MTTNTLPIINFSREFGWNPLEMEQLGASPIISGDTPQQAVLHNFAAFFQAHGGQWPPPSIGQSCKDQNGNAVPCPSEQDNSKPSSGTRGYEPPEDGRIYPPEAQPGAKPSLELGVPDTGKTSSIVEDYLKRSALLLLAIVLIAIAVVSLR